MQADWVRRFSELVEKRPMVVFQFDSDDWQRLRESRGGANEFTVARPHEKFDGIRCPTACLIFGHDGYTREEDCYFGLVTSRQPISTLDSRVKVNRAHRISPRSKVELFRLITNAPHAGNLRRKLKDDAEITRLSPKLSAHIVEKLAGIESNRSPMQAAAASLVVPKHFSSIEAIQEDAVQMALRAFGLSVRDKAITVDLPSDKSTSLTRINILEDAVVEHDARHVPGFDLVNSHVTGHATFEKGSERLDIYTANKRPLEQTFGVDLVYLNRTQKNVVMVQYKMLEPVTGDGGENDWIYRPDSQLDSEIERMRKFSKAHSPKPFEYRLNPQVFYLKFVKRDGALRNAAIVLPIEHFEQVRADAASVGPRGGIRLSFEALGGQYLRQGPFLDLIRSGYIGAHAETTDHLSALVDAIVRGDRALVAAIQSRNKEDPSTESDELD